MESEVGWEDTWVVVVVMLTAVWSDFEWGGPQAIIVVLYPML